MRMSSWTPDIVRFMEDAASVTDYFGIMARVGTQGLPSGSVVLDAGCGMGQLACSMAAFGHTVHAVDKSADAVAYASRHANKAGAGRVSVRQGDYFQVAAQSDPYDHMVFCLSARVEDAFAAARMNGSKTLTVINKVSGCSGADGDPSNRLPRPVVGDVERTLDALDARGIVCDAHEMTLEFGQPFRTLEDAARYFSLFRTRSFPRGVTRRELTAILEPFNEQDFAYYLPAERHLAVFAVDMEASLRAGAAAAYTCETREPDAVRSNESVRAAVA